MTLLVGSIFHMTRKIVSEMTYNVSMGTLNPTIHTYIYILWLNLCRQQICVLRLCTAVITRFWHTSPTCLSLLCVEQLYAEVCLTFGWSFDQDCFFILLLLLLLFGTDESWVLSTYSIYLHACGLAASAGVWLRATESEITVTRWTLIEDY